MLFNSDEWLSPNLQKLNHPIFVQNNLQVDVLRLDMVHPVVSGNKGYKLRYHLQEAESKGHQSILTFGGAWSNHLVATAYACQQLGYQATAIVRGERPKLFSNALSDAAGFGMVFHFVSRIDYTLLQSGERELPPSLKEHYIIPEGGKGLTGIKGAAEIINVFPMTNYRYCACAVGTGTMMAGLLSNGTGSEIIGFPVLKVSDRVNNEFERMMQATGNPYRLEYDYHFGGYAKKNSELLNFMNDLYRTSALPTDFVYTAKLFYGMIDLAKKQHFIPGTRICLIHSGGLQGNRSLPPGTLAY